MSKKLFVLLVGVAALLGLFLNVFLGGYVSAKLSQISWLSKYDIIRPQAPIVINRRETVRANDGTDILDAINTAKQRLSAVVQISNGQAVRTGNAINITADGSFATVTGAFPLSTATYAIIMVDGRIAPITERISDPATGLVFFKALATNSPVVNFTSSKEVAVGQRMVSIEQTTHGFTPVAYPVFTTSAQSSLAGKTYEANLLTRGFSIGEQASALPGAAIVNLSGDVAGLWSGDRVISSDIIKRTVSLYLANQLERPNWGFAYEVINSFIAKVLGVSEGARVLRVAKGTAADQGGLAAGDIITMVAENKITDELSLEELLEQRRTNEATQLTVTRGQQTLILTLTPKRLQ